ncbi:MAG: efflux RND transporter periplasmic adaptor subunit [Gemmatimonadaceae bacterium]
MRRTDLLPFVVALALSLAACGAPDGASTPEQSAPRAAGEVVTVVDTTIDAMLEAAGVAGPIAQATLSTKLMGTVTAVLVQEGDRVAAGQPLVRLDARDLAARQSQVSAGIAEAEAVHRDATTQAGRMRALHADSAATRAQLDAAETGLARAEAAVRQARAGASELEVLTGYSVVRAPFDGVVTRRLVDPGAFAAPGAPLVTVQDSHRLRVSVTVAPEAARGLARGSTIGATIEGVAVPATVEGVVPASAGNVYTINAIVDNPGARLLSGSAATLQLPQGTRRAVVIPAAAVRREGDLTGVLVRGATGDELRWVRLGATAGDRTEVLGGLRAGDRVVVPTGMTPAPGVAADSRRN